MHEQEYLMDELTHIKLPAYHIGLWEAHKQVFQLCMYYLVASLDPQIPPDNDGTPHSTERGMATYNLIPSWPLLDYIFSYGFDHLMHLEPMDDATLDSMMALQSEIQKHPLKWKRMCSLASLYHPYKSWITPEHDFIVCILISMFPEPFLRAFLSRTPSKTKYSSNPLVHIVHFNKVDHARMLLSQDVDVNSSGCDTNGMKHALPLVVALHHKNDMLVDLFLKEGSAAIPEQVYWTMLHTARCEYPPHLVSSLLQADEFVE